MPPEEQQTQPAIGPPVGEGADVAGEQTGVLLNQVQQQLNSLRELISHNGKRQTELQALESELRKRAATLDLRERELADRSKAFDEQMAAQGAELDGRAAAIESRAAKVEQQVTEFFAREQGLAERQLGIEQAEASVRAKEAEFAGQQNTGNAAREAAEARCGQMKSELEAAQAAKASAERVRDEAVGAAEDSRKHAETALALAEQAEKKALDSQARLEEHLRTAAAQPAFGGEPGEEVSRLRAEVAERDRLLQERDNAIRERAEALAAAIKQQESTQQTYQSAIMQRDNAIRELAERLRVAGAAAGAAVKPSADADELDRIELRRIRLAKYKRLLGAQSGKIVKAKAALQKRVAECEQVLAQRAKLAEAITALEAQKKLVQLKVAKTGSMAMVMYGLVIFAAVSGMAWGVARQIAPATFAAKATLSADGKGRTLTPEDCAAWSANLKSLVQDPQVMAAAAENFARRGMPALGTATSVKQRFGSLYVQSDKPGEMSVEYRAEGADRSARELETFLSAVIGVSNTQLESRGDGAATTISRQPAAGADPLESERVIYAGGLAGGGLAGAGVLGVLAYRYLRRAKEKFENDTGELSALS